jgi:hypothetical protein
MLSLPCVTDLMFDNNERKAWAYLSIFGEHCRVHSSRHNVNSGLGGRTMHIFITQ